MTEQDVISHSGISLGPAHPDSNENAEELLFGFWVFLMSDAIVFGLLFATYATMLHATAAGPGPKQLFDISSTLVETLALLGSSFTYGMASLSLKYGTRRSAVGVALHHPCARPCLPRTSSSAISRSMFHKDAGPDRSGFLSAFFALVPLHGLHVLTGCVWMLVIMAQMASLRRSTSGSSSGC